jgi:hypothetical protein
VGSTGGALVDSPGNEVEKGVTVLNPPRENADQHQSETAFPEEGLRKRTSITAAGGDETTGGYSDEKRSDV